MVCRITRNIKKPYLESKWVILPLIIWPVENRIKSPTVEIEVLLSKRNLTRVCRDRRAPRISYLQVSRFFCRAICSQFPRFHTVPKVSTDHSNKPRLDHPEAAGETAVWCSQNDFLERHKHAQFQKLQWFTRISHPSMSCIFTKLKLYGGANPNWTASRWNHLVKYLPWFTLYTLQDWWWLFARLCTYSYTMLKNGMCQSGTNTLNIYEKKIFYHVYIYIYIHMLEMAWLSHS